MSSSELNGRWGFRVDALAGTYEEKAVLGGLVPVVAQRGQQGGQQVEGGSVVL